MSGRSAFQDSPRLLTALVVVTLLGFLASNYESADELPLVHKAASLLRNDSMPEAKTTAGKVTEKMLDDKDYRQKKERLVAEFTQMIDDCHEWTTIREIRLYDFNITCYENKMRTAGLRPNQQPFGYEGIVEGHRLVIEHLGTIPNPEGGLRHKFAVLYLDDH